MSFKEKTLIEIGKLNVNATSWDGSFEELRFEWVEDMPPPYTDNQVSIDITKDDAIKLIEVLKTHFAV